MQFTAEPTQASSAITRGLPPITTTDDTYTFTNEATAGRTVLMERVENGVRTPQAWTRTQGKGRVFYTAFGSEQTVALPALPPAGRAGRALRGPGDGASRRGTALKMPDLQYRGRAQRPELREPRPGAEVSSCR